MGDGSLVNVTIETYSYKF